MMPNFSINDDETYNKLPDYDDDPYGNKLLRQQSTVTTNGGGELSEKHRTSGTGILEFSPTMAGQDVTPVNLDFSNKKLKKQASNNSFQSLAGNKMISTLLFDAIECCC